jgi:cell division protein ZapE
VTPIEYYQRLIQSEQILADPQQAFAMSRLQNLYEQLNPPAKATAFLGKFKATKIVYPQGLYIWGEVGIGKTFLTDCFYYCLPSKFKLRIHFHNFMRMVHEQLTTLQGVSRPLEKIAKRLATEAQIICFDELLVQDITDAMVLAGLLKALYHEKICMLFTSNTPPDNLYPKGLQRDSFLPAIELLKKHSEILHISSKQDYRLRHKGSNRFYYSPLNEAAERQMQLQFEIMSEKVPESTQPIRIYDRNIPVRKAAGKVIWFNFLDICGVPRNQNDFLEIANNWHTVLISNVTTILPRQNDLARTFINLVDVFYDANIRLIISAEKPIEEIYQGERMMVEFVRTRSRLVAMQA